MKKLLILTATIVAAALLCGAVERSPRQVVLLWSYQGFYNTFTNGHYAGGAYDGSKIYCADSSSGAPVFPNAITYNGPAVNELTNTAEALAILLSRGFRITGSSDSGQYFMLVR